MYTMPNLSPESRAAARLASGQVVWLHHGDHYFWMVAAEGASPNSLPGTGGHLFLTCERAAALGSEVTGPLAMLKLPPRSDVLETLINPLRLLQSKMLVDFDVQEPHSHHAALAAIPLIKQSGLLPAFILGAGAAPPLDALIYETGGASGLQLSKISQASVPLRLAPDAAISAFRDQDGMVHLAIVVGQPRLDGAPLVRLHSSCLTGDLLGSLRCDCGDQLQAALGFMNLNGGGILLYLDQEGRGIGLGNKLRAYELQDQGLDTYEANHALGFADDERSFAVAAALLRALGVGQVRLLTNNPHKVMQLIQAGMPVAERIPLQVAAGPANAHYLATKAARGGHLFTGK